MNNEKNSPNETEEPNQQPQEDLSVAEGIHVPQDSGIVGGASGEAADITTASGPSDSGAG